ncbi:MAG: hypothetical protein H6816_06600 [Phycisphaerales bacterium]|nr:hypothetical protein [Phycisphaerales bacterium]
MGFLDAIAVDVCDAQAVRAVATSRPPAARKANDDAQAWLPDRAITFGERPETLSPDDIARLDQRSTCREKITSAPSRSAIALRFDESVVSATAGTAPGRACPDQFGGDVLGVGCAPPRFNT